MPFTLHKVPKKNHDFTAIVALDKAAQSDPFNGMWPMFEGPNFEECVTRSAMWHAHDPTSYWIYATDDDTGEVVGALGWNVYEKNPYEDGVPEIIPEWWPEVISYCVVHPSSRRSGVASMMMEQALKQADELKFDTLVESTEWAEAFYKTHGFVTTGDFTLDANVFEPTEEFVSLEEKLFPLHGWVMWRTQSKK